MDNMNLIQRWAQYARGETDVNPLEEAVESDQQSEESLEQRFHRVMGWQYKLTEIMGDAYGPPFDPRRRIPGYFMVNDVVHVWGHAPQSLALEASMASFLDLVEKHVDDLGPFWKGLASHDRCAFNPNMEELIGLYCRITGIEADGYLYLDETEDEYTWDPATLAFPSKVEHNRALARGGIDDWSTMPVPETFYATPYGE